MKGEAEPLGHGSILTHPFLLYHYPVATWACPHIVTRGLYMRTISPHPRSYQILVHDSFKTISCQKTHDVGPQNGWPNLHKTVGVLTQVREYVWNFHSISIQQVV